MAKKIITPSDLDGSSIWLNAGSKTIYSCGLKAGTRYIVDIIGFFE